jgi:tetratricopeptide (TPR) repeat protein
MSDGLPAARFARADRTMSACADAGGGLPSASRDLPDRQKLAGQLVVFTGKLSSLGRREASALVASLGGCAADDVSAKTTMLVIGDEGVGPTRQRVDCVDEAASKSNKLKRAEELNAARPGSLIQILSEAEFCNLIGVPTPDSLKRQYHALRDLLARYRALREDHVRYLVKYGVIRPVLRTNADTFFAFPDLALIKQANDELSQGVSFPTIVRMLMAAGHGQLAFDFRLDASPARVLELRRQTASRPEARAEAPPAPRRESELAEGFFRAASLLDDGVESQREEAAALYRRALDLDPYLVAALINLANIHYSRDDLAVAQTLYERAIGLDSDFFEAHFNLGNIYHDLGRFGEAQVCYVEALRLNPFYADAHFYLAVTFEKMALSQQARPHWRAYQQLAPDGEWVELAKEFSD